MRRAGIAIAAWAVVAAATGAGSGGSRAFAASLPHVETGALPGPEVLYEAAPDVPQLQNRDPRFRAPYDRVSGTDRYVDGEYLYTDHLFDDHGSDTQGTGGGFRASAAGKITYPTDAARYGGNAADLVELRISTGPTEIAYRFSLNTLLVEDSTIATIAFDVDGDAGTGSAVLSRDPGSPFPGTDAVLTTWGGGAEWSWWDGSAWATTALSATADLEANQITVTVPRSVADPAGVWNATLAAGLYDPVGGGWLRPARSATGTTPGGAGVADPEPSGIFNLGFRFDEQALGRNTPPDEDQAAALRAHEPTRFAHAIDFDLLDARGAASTVPATGTMIRFFPSRLDLDEGVVSGGGGIVRGPLLPGRLQPYSIYVPSTYTPGAPVPLTLNLHSLNQHHWQYNGSTGVRQLGEERGSIVVTPEARGPSGWYEGAAEYDVFEVWNDVAAHFALDPGRTALTGYSMGGYGTYRIGTLYPDLFGRAASVVGPPGSALWIPGTAPVGGGGMASLTNLWLANARNLPYMNVAAGEDELVPYAGPFQQNLGPDDAGGFTSFRELGYRFRFLTLPAGEHYTIGVLGYDLPMLRDFLGDAAVDRDPPRVTYVRLPANDDPSLGLLHDKAYWLSEIALADETLGQPLPKGTVDARSLTGGGGDPVVTVTVGVGTEPLPYVETGQDWAAAPPVAAENRLVMTLDNVGAVTVDATRAGLNTARDVRLTVVSTHAATVRLISADGTTRAIAIAPGSHEHVLPAP